jgi:hypothetical protein
MVSEAVEQGHPIAEFYLGVMYPEDLVVPQDCVPQVTTGRFSTVSSDWKRYGTGGHVGG